MIFVGAGSLSRRIRRSAYWKGKFIEVHSTLKSWRLPNCWHFGSRIAGSNQVKISWLIDGSNGRYKQMDNGDQHCFCAATFEAVSVDDI